MAELIGKVLFWSVLAFLFACIEIESEGKYGWADKKETWFRVTGFWGKAYGIVMGGKPLTGYHAFMFFLPLLVTHAHFFMGVPWTGAKELETWALYFAWCPFWDYSWFVLNPAYKGKFRKENIWWHAKSYWVFGRIPFDYIAGVLASFVFAAAVAWVESSTRPLIDNLYLIGGFCGFTVALFLIAPFYHRWYARMREKDDRDKVKIFYP